MSEWSWESISERYRNLASERSDTPYGDFAQGMLDLLPKLREQLKYENVKVGMALHTLTIGFKDKLRTVHVDWEKPNTFAIYLDHAKDNFYGEKIIVSSEDAVEKIKEYLQRLEM